LIDAVLKIRLYMI